MRKLNNLSTVLALALLCLTAFVWFEIFAGRPSNVPRMYFLDVGQGDSELAIFPSNVKVLTDAGPDKKVSQSLNNALGAGDRYIDLGIISHPQADHFNGFNYLLDNYKFGAFIFNGRSDSPPNAEWQALLDKIKARKIPLITLLAGSDIKSGEDRIDFLSPDNNYIQSAELNDVGFVELIKTGFFRALLTADIGFNIEDYLIKKGVDLRADILKVCHHGSKYSSGESFLKTVNPKVAIIEVGAGNKFGHPTAEALVRLASVSAKIFRTDQNGTVEILPAGGKLEVFTEK